MKVSSASISPHHSRCSPTDLMALVRVWEWERTAKDRIRQVIEDGDLTIVYQAIHRLDTATMVPGGYEALARFPAATGIPTGLWFRVAAELGLSVELELATAGKAIEIEGFLPGDLFLSVNVTMPAIPGLIELLSDQPRRYVLEVSHNALHRPEIDRLLAAIRSAGIKVAIDDVPLSDLHHLEASLARLGPDMVKVDLLGGLTDDPMARFNVAAGVAWCAERGIDLIAERVERRRDLGILCELGVEWAQGYGLSRPQPDIPTRARLDLEAGGD